MTQATYTRSADAKKDGWFSRRHATNAAHVAASDARLQRLEDSLTAARARQRAADEKKAARLEREAAKISVETAKKK